MPFELQMPFIVWDIPKIRELTDTDRFTHTLIDIAKRCLHQDNVSLNHSLVLVSCVRFLNWNNNPKG